MDPDSVQRELVAVVGASGNVGRHVVGCLVSRGCRVRALGSSAGESAGNVERERLDFNDNTKFATALRGVDRLFLIRPPAISRIKTTIEPFLDVAERSGVRRVVFVSVAGAETNRLIPHHRIEQKLKASTMDWTMIRPGFFAQNFQDAYRDDIVQDDRVLLPAGDGRVAFIDAADIGEVAAVALVENRFVNMGIHVTGPEAITFHTAVSILSDTIGRTITYEPISALGYFAHLTRRQGIGVMQAFIQTILHAGLRNGDAEIVTSGVAEVLGHPPRSFTDYVERSADRWISPHRTRKFR